MKTFTIHLSLALLAACGGNLNVGDPGDGSTTGNVVGSGSCKASDCAAYAIHCSTGTATKSAMRSRRGEFRLHADRHVHRHERDANVHVHAASGQLQRQRPVWLDRCFGGLRRDHAVERSDDLDDDAWRELRQYVLANDRRVYLSIDGWRLWLRPRATRSERRHRHGDHTGVLAERSAGV